MGMPKNRLSLLLWSCLYLAVFGWFWLAYRSLTLGVEWAAWLYPEDHFFENLGAVSLFVAGGLCLYAFARGKGAGCVSLRNGIYLALAVLFLFGAGEEISWGQRLFPPQEPSGQTFSDSQPAFDLHDLPAVETSRVLYLENIAILLLATLAAGLPLAWLALPGLRRALHGQFPAVLLGMGPLFLINQALVTYASDHYKPWYRYKILRFPQAVQAIKESNFEVLCAIMALIAVWELSQFLKRRSSL